MNRAIDDLRFVVVDLETTGLFPKADRIIEIAALVLDRFGNRHRELNTLVNPHRDLGPQYVHAITAREIQCAPTFEEIAGDLVECLAGAVFVSHNSTFDRDFIGAEFRRLGHQPPTMPTMCTLAMTSRLFPAVPNRSLSVCCTHLGVPHSESHNAHSDAEATAGLLKLCLERLLGDRDPVLPELGIMHPPPTPEYWPSIEPTGKRITRSEVAEQPREDAAYLAKLVHLLDDSEAHPPNVTKYVAYLDRALEDRLLSKAEAHKLLDLAASLGMSRDDVSDTHDQYLRHVISCAKSDGVVTDAERRDISDVAQILSIDAEQVEQLLADESSPATFPQEPAAAIDTEDKSVCFTGTLACRIDGHPVTKAFAEEVAEDGGMVVQKTVNKKLDYLVTADPHSMSGKAKKARQYGIRILAEPVFWRTMGVEVS